MAPVVPAPPPRTRLPVQPRHGGVLLSVRCPDTDCSRCDAVCCRLPVVLLPGDAVPAHLVDRDDHGLEVMAQDEDGWCAAIDPLRMRCTIYAQRPSICRQFEMGGHACLDVRAEYRAQSARGIPLAMADVATA